MTFLLFSLSSKAKKTAQCSVCYRNGLQIWASNWSDVRDASVWPGLGLILHVQALATPHPRLDESQDPTTCLLPLIQSLGFQTGWSEAGAEGCKAPMCHTTWSELQGCPCTGRLPASLYTTPLQNQLLGGLCFSFISPGPVHASLINPAKFQTILKTVPINWLFNQFDQKMLLLEVRRIHVIRNFLQDSHFLKKV